MVRAEKKKRLLLIDANSLVHRAFHALPPLSTSTGEMVNAVYGFCLAFFKAQKEFHPEYIAAAFDVAGPTFRDKKFKAYKAKRAKAPDELYNQMPLVKKVLAAFHVPVYEKEGFEADDIIGTIALQAPRKQINPPLETIILSGDADVFQLVDSHTKAYTLAKGIQDSVLYDEQAVKKRFGGLQPAQLIDYKALRGDPSDNIPGVTGIGEKTAIALLSEFSSLDNIYRAIQENTDKAKSLKPRVKNMLAQYKDQALISKDLARIDRHVPIDFKLSDLAWKDFDEQEIKQLFSSFGFRSLILRLPELHGGEKKKEQGTDDQSASIEQLERDGVLSKELAEVERQLTPVLRAMEKTGIAIDAEYLAALEKDMRKGLAGAESKIFQLAGSVFNVSSPRQLSAVLFETLLLSPKGMHKTPGGIVSTASPELEKIKSLHPIIQEVLNFRELSKLLNTYVAPLPLLADKEGRIHTHFLQFGAETGRLSCLPAGTYINTQRGLVGIEKVKSGDFIRTPHGPRRVLHWQQTGIKEVIFLRFSNGIILRCSPDHQIRTRGEWVRAGDIKKGTPAYMSFAPGMFGEEVELNVRPIAKYQTKKSPVLPTHWTRHLAELVGYEIADGHIVRSNYNGKPAKVVLAFGWEDQSLMSDFEKIIRELFGKQATRRITRTCPVLETSGVDIAGLFEQVGAGGRSQAIRVPPSLFRAPEQIVAAFLRGYFEGDGHVGDDVLSVRSTSLSMLEDVQQLLTIFGISSSVFQGAKDPRGYAPRHILRILGERSKKVFNERINFLSARKQNICAKFVEEYRKKSTAELLTLPEDFEVEHIKSYLYAVYREAGQRVPIPVMVFAHKFIAGRETMPLWRAQWIVDSSPEEAELEESKFLREVTTGQYFEVKVIEIRHEAPASMYDVAVEDVEQYMAQGILVHNSSSPNLQNVPLQGTWGKKVRKGFISAPGHQLLSFDYSQMELRLAAHIAKEEKMQKIFQADEDIHRMTAAEVFGIPAKDVSDEMRYRAKALNFGVLYGMGARGFAESAKIPVQEAQQFIDEYFVRFPKIAAYIAETKEFVKEKGYAETLFGRRRYLPDVNSFTPQIRAAAERAAVNFPIQGSSADIMKMAMVRIFQECENSKCRMLLQIHDELLFEVADDIIHKSAVKILRMMEEVAQLAVPLIVRIKTGCNWGEMKRVET